MLYNCFNASLFVTDLLKTLKVTTKMLNAQFEIFLNSNIKNLQRFEEVKN